MPFVNAPKKSMVEIEIIYIDEQGVILRHCCLFPAGTTVEQALQQSRLLKDYPMLCGLDYGVFAKKVLPTTVLANGDRIELYRPLKLDPKEKRRQRAQKS